MQNNIFTRKKHRHFFLQFFALFLLSVIFISTISCASSSKKETKEKNIKIQEFQQNFSSKEYNGESEYASKFYYPEDFEILYEIQNENIFTAETEANADANAFQADENELAKTDLSYKTGTGSNQSQKSIIELNNYSSDIILTPNVTTQMLNPYFWLAKIENPFEVKMTSAQIQKWNTDILDCRFSPTEYFRIVSDLREYRRNFSTQQIRDEMQRYRPGITWYKKIQTESGEKIYKLTREDWLDFYDKMNYEPLGTKEYYAYTTAYQYPEKNDYYPVKKGVCIRRSCIRSVPDNIFYSDDVSFWYDDVAQISGVLQNEPVLILWESKDKEWYLVQTYYSTGWIPKKDIAICTSAQFNNYFDYSLREKPDFITVTADKFSLEDDYFVYCEDASFDKNLTLYMGTYLQLADWNKINIPENFKERTPHSSYLVEIPYKKDDESLGIAYASIPAGICTLGFLPYTAANILTLAFQSLGKRYGWGGMADERDCTEYTKEIFRCVGLNFAKNSSAQAAMPGKTISFLDLSHEQKCAVLDNLPAGTILYFYGHVSIYLGKNDDEYYTISSMGTYYPDSKTIQTKVNACSVNINSLNLFRKNNKSWLDDLVAAKLIYEE